MNLIVCKCIRCRENDVWLDESHVHIGGVCEDCIMVEARQAGAQKRAAELMQRWDSICPPDFRDTDTELLPQKDLSLRALKWPFFGKMPWKGLNLWGHPRTGKTRTLYLILRKAHFMGKAVKFYGPSQFAQQCELRDWKTAPWIRELSSCDIVAFDDIDKCKMTGPQEQKFFSVIDARNARRLPTFFTGNSDGAKLETMFRNGPAIIARIREHCDALHFPRPEQQQEMEL